MLWRLFCVRRSSAPDAAPDHKRGVLGLRSKFLRPIHSQVELAAPVVQFAGSRRRRFPVVQQLAGRGRLASWPAARLFGLPVFRPRSSSDTAKARNSPSESQRRWMGDRCGCCKRAAVAQTHQPAKNPLVLVNHFDCVSAKAHAMDAFRSSR